MCENCKYRDNPIDNNYKSNPCNTCICWGDDGCKEFRNYVFSGGTGGEDENFTTCKYVDGFGCNHPNGTEKCAGTGYLQWEPAEYHNPADVEALRKAREALDYWRELYGIGLEVLNWHMNGDIETFDSFYDSSGTYEALAEIDKAIGGKEDV